MQTPTKASHWVVLGAGFRGLTAAYLLAKTGKKVSLVDASSQVGAVLHSQEYKGYYLDKGCHLFDNDHDQLTSVMLEILDHEVHPVAVKYASFLNGKKSAGVSIADLSLLEEEVGKQILWETLQLTRTPTTEEAHTVKDELLQRHGKKATEIISGLLQKTHLLRAEEIDAMAFDLLPFKRLKFTSNDVGRVLKQIPELDEKVAVSSENMPLEFYENQAGKSYPHRNFFPSEKGMKHFCDKALEKLQMLGVTIQLSTVIEKITTANNQVQLKVKDKEEPLVADKLYWTGVQERIGDLFEIPNKLKTLVFPVPMVLYYFFIDEKFVSDYTYIHNFNKHHQTFRASIPTNYGRANAPEGKAYICVEVPTFVNSPIWTNKVVFADRIWKELREMGFFTEEKCKYEEVLSIAIPGSYKVPLTGYKKELDRVLDQIDQRNILGLETWDFAKNRILEKLLEQLAELN